MNEPPKLLELFAGSRSVGKAAQALGFDVFSSDLTAFDGIDYVADVLAFDTSRVPFTPTVIWASPPCTAFSVASIGHHWAVDGKYYKPKTDDARLGLRILEATLAIIRQFPDAVFFMENPRGMMRMMRAVAYFKRWTVTYCQYGDTRQKPTDIWTNSPVWIPLPACPPSAPCHDAAPRGSRTGTQGIKGAYLRSLIPPPLCLDILQSVLPDAAWRYAGRPQQQDLFL